MVTTAGFGQKWRMKPIDGLSFQLYSARFIESLEEQFALLASLGYRRVEPFGGLLGRAGELKRLMDRHGIAAPTCHVGMDRLRADPKGTVALCRDLGVSVILAPAPLQDERTGDAAHWTRLGRELAGIGEVVRGEGLEFGWHNHHWEFAVEGGRTHLDRMFEAAPGMVWEVDVAWLVRGGADPLAEIARYSGRIVACHVKDLAPAGECKDEDGWADPGHGTLDWAALVPALKAAGCRFFVAEHDRPNDVARFARRARMTVESWV